MDILWGFRRKKLYAKGNFWHKLKENWNGGQNICTLLPLCNHFTAYLMMFGNVTFPVRETLKLYLRNSVGTLNILFFINMYQGFNITLKWCPVAMPSSVKQIPCPSNFRKHEIQSKTAQNSIKICTWQSDQSINAPCNLLGL